MRDHSKLTFPKQLLLFLLVTAVYAILGYGGLKLATLHPNSSPIWYCSGYAAGVLLLFGNWLAPAIFLGALLTNIFVATPVIPLLCIAYGNTLEAVLGAMLVRWILKTNFLKNYSELFAVILCALLPTAVSAIIGVNSLQFFGSGNVQNFFYAMFTWWSGDGVGMLVILPLFLEFYISDQERPFVGFFRILFGLVLTFLIFWIDWKVFFEGHNQAFCWLLGPGLICLSFIVGPVFSRICLILLSTMTVYLTLRGFSLFEFGDLNLNLIYTQCILLSFSLATLFYRPYRVKLNHTMKFMGGNALGWIFLFLVVFVVSSREESYLKEHFSKTVTEALNAVKDSEAQLQIILEGGKAFVRVHPEVTNAEWKEYVDSLELGKRLNVISGLGLIFPYDKSQKVHVPVTEMDSAYAATFNDRLVITHIEPMSTNHKALGLDIGSEPNRRAAAMNSKVQNKTEATRPIYLVQKDFKVPGFLILHPIKGRHFEFIGWSYMPVFYDEFFEYAFKPYEHLLTTKVSVDGELYYSGGGGTWTPPNAHFKVSRTTTIFGVRHVIDFYPSDAFLRLHSGTAPAIAIFLSIFIYVFSSFLLELMTFSQRSEELVEKKSKELDASRMKLIYNSKMASLGEMASGMAHEINNPLSAISVKMEVLKMMMKERGIEGGEMVLEVEKIKSIVGRIGKIVGGLRTFSRSSELDPFEPVLLKQVLSETLDLCGEKFKAKGIPLNMSNVPDVLIICKPGQISQVILNLLNNSADAIEHLEDRWIKIGFKLSADRIQVLVIDSGRGIPPEIASRIMEPFYTTKEPNMGTGLGLSISKGIVEDHQGRLWLDSNGFHTTFILELPTMTSGELGDG